MNLKKYQVIIQDEWNNLHHLDFYDKLEDAVDDINEWLLVYDAKIEKDELVEYPSTFGYCFDREVMTPDETYIYI